MGKYAKYSKHYGEEWEHDTLFKGWLCKNRETLILAGFGEAHCKICTVALRAQRNELKVHGETKKHLEKATAFNLKTQRTLSDFGVKMTIDGQTKINDIKLVLHVADHNSTNSVDHLCNLLKEMGSVSHLEKLKLHRTKCSKMILNIVSPGMLKELVEDVGDQYYSIILDESTDVSTIKYMAYCKRYYSKKADNMCTDFLGFNEVGSATAKRVHEDFLNFIKLVGLKHENLVGIGTDGASHLCGVNESSYTLLKQQCPNLQLIKCSCHSLNLCASKACKELPSNLEFLLRETRNWFAHSPLRQLTYTEVYKKINTSKLPKLITLSNTRWLAWYKAISSNLVQWDILKRFFNDVSKSSKEKCYTARTLAEMYNDDSNYLYLLFLDNILREVTRVNIAFQRANADITKLYADLKILLVSLSRMIFEPRYLRLIALDDDHGMLHSTDIAAVKAALSKAYSEFGNSLLPIEAKDFGDRFMAHTKKKTVSPTAMKDIKERATLFIVKLCDELVERLPNNLTIIERIRYISPRYCLSQTLTIPISQFPWALAAKDADWDLIEMQ